MKHIQIATATLLLVMTVIPFTANGQPTINRDKLLEDAELVNWNDMTRDEIQSFLLQYGSGLAHLSFRDVDGVERDAATIIWRASQHYGISPRFLLVLLQREQSLVETENPSPHQLNWAMGYGVCDSCRTSDPGLTPYRGFAQQVAAAAWRNRYYVTHPREFRVQVGKAVSIDGVTVTPQNQVTANLYIYTPHLLGNDNFVRLWHRYFSGHYPDGSLLRSATDGSVWLIQNGERRLFASIGTLASDFDQSKVITVADHLIDVHLLGTPITFPTYSLLETPEGTRYLFADQALRPVSPEAFRHYGYNPQEVIPVTTEDIAGIPLASPLSNTVHVGRLVRDAETSKMYYITEQKKFLVVDEQIGELRFPDLSLTQATAADLVLPNGLPITLPSGVLVKIADSPVVYAIDGRIRRPVPTEDDFLDLGYKWSQIITVPNAVLDIHPQGAPLMKPTP